MKLQLLLIAFLSALLFTACQKEEETNCRDNTLAVYEGQDNNGEQGSIELQEGAGEKGVIAVMKVNNPTSPTPFTFNMTGELNENCSVLTIPSQSIGIGTLSGSFTLVDDKMNGTVTNDTGQSFALTLTKK
ncbi:MAG: hypothetical protein ACRBFS_15865 [Aureispira sp.]